MVTMGVTYTHYAKHYNTREGQYRAVTAEGARFPWTTGSVTVTAVGRGPHKTIHYARGYDNRATTPSPYGLGTIQLVSPVLTRRFGFTDYETAGIAILRIEFVNTAPDADSDGIGDGFDNCSGNANTNQDDTDGDDCGNLCDADYDNSGAVGYADYGLFAGAFGTTDMEKCHNEPIPGCIVGFLDFGFFAQTFGSTPGPSGTTAGTTECP
jgi:hypothetical protein